MRVFVTGDTHGVFKRVKKFADKMETTTDDVLIILGDVGLNYFNDNRDYAEKSRLTKYLNLTLFCLHGNHEIRPHHIYGYQIKEFWGGKVYAQPEFPNLLFAIDGEVYNIPSKDGTTKECLVCGGAYSVDKYYRLHRGWGWWADEQPDQSTKDKVESVLDQRNWEIDGILTHTVPVSCEPIEDFIPGIDQSKVDKSTEEWFQKILEKLNHFDFWYAGHYHSDKFKYNGKLRIFFNDFEEF